MHDPKKITISALVLLLLLGGVGFTTYRAVYEMKSQDIRSRAAISGVALKIVGNPTVRLGETITLGITIEPINSSQPGEGGSSDQPNTSSSSDGVTAAELHIVFPKDKLTIKGFIPFRQGPLPVPVVLSPITPGVLPTVAILDNELGRADIKMTAYCDKDQCVVKPPAGFLAYVAFEAKAPGTAEISFAKDKPTQVAAVGATGNVVQSLEPLMITIVEQVAPTETVVNIPTGIPPQNEPAATAVIATPITSIPTRAQPINTLQQTTVCQIQYICTPECAANEDPEYKRACANPEPYRNFPKYSTCFTAVPVCQ